MRLTFDRGTLLLADLGDLPEGFDVAQIPGVLWDERVAAPRAPARLCYPIASELRRRGVPIADMPRPALEPPAGFRPFELRPYQEAALAAWRQAGRRGMVVLPTGSGKTRLALGAIAATRTPALCLAPTRALCDQWAAALAAVWDGPVGRFGDGERMTGAVTIATYAGAYRHMSSLGDKFGLLIVDEAHHFGEGWRDEALEMSIAPLRLGLTATPPGPGPAADRLASLVGPVVFERTIGDLAGRYLAPLERVTWHLALDPDERREHDALWEIYRQARRAFEGNHLGAIRGNGWEDFLHEAARTDEGRRGIAAWRRARRILAFPRRKREALALLLGHHRAQRTLVFVADNQTAYAVAREHLVMPLTCDIGRTERQEVLDRFRGGTLRALVSAQVLNEGIDVPDAEVGIVVAGRMGEREHVQRVGRLLRPVPGKRALVYELVVERSSEARQAERRGSVLLSERDLPLRLIEERAFIDYLGPQDEPWVRVLLAEMARFEGRRRRELAERLAEPLPCEAPHFKRRAASRALLAFWRREPTAGAPAPQLKGGRSIPRPAALRQELFGAAAATEAPATTVADEAAARLGLTREAVLDLLFADLPGERPVRAPNPPPTPAEAMLRTNLAIAQAVLMRASRVELRVEGGVRPIVRLAKLRGLLCTILDVPDLGRPMLELSGPFSLFQHTLLYGRALAELLPHLAWCARFELRAACSLRGRLATVSVDSGDPIFPAAPPTLYDSRLEERFAGEIAKLAPDWDLLREPEPLRAGGTLIFPDFLLRHRLQPRRQVLIEIVGFWTPQYLASKLEKLRQTDTVCLLCVDEDRACATADLPPHLPVVRFRRRIDAAAVLRAVERLTDDQTSHAA